MTTTEKLKRLKESSDDIRIKNSKLTGGKGVTQSFINKMKFYIDNWSIQNNMTKKRLSNRFNV